MNFLMNSFELINLLDYKRKILFIKFAFSLLLIILMLSKTFLLEVKLEDLILLF